MACVPCHERAARRIKSGVPFVLQTGIREEERSMSLLEEAKQAMEGISQEADFFVKARKKRRQISQGDYTFGGDR